mmetsp:Transcript_35616/g.58022  ORF Transcript_35616/g.58022 Transcript_35616/m.58022 type:complete len:231 (-) Transcript_35616:671-1363(-)
MNTPRGILHRHRHGFQHGRSGGIGTAAVRTAPHDRSRLGHSGGISLLQIPRVVEPVQTIGIFEEGVNVRPVIVPRRRILGIYPARQQGHISHTCGGHSCGNSLVIGSSRCCGRRIVLRVGNGNPVSWGQRIDNCVAVHARRCSSSRCHCTEYCILQRRHGQRPMGRRMDHLLTSPSILLGGSSCGSTSSWYGTHSHGRRGHVWIEHVGHGRQWIGHLIFFLGTIGWWLCH